MLLLFPYLYSVLIAVCIVNSVLVYSTTRNFVPFGKFAILFLSVDVFHTNIIIKSNTQRRYTNFGTLVYDYLSLEPITDYFYRVNNITNLDRCAVYVLLAQTFDFVISLFLNPKLLGNLS